MPTIDKPLHELREYQGINPRPDDFDAYWEKGLQEMRATDPRVELRPVAHPARFAECFDLFFTGVGGSRIHAKYLRPKAKAASQPHPAVLQFHGYTGNCGDWYDKLGFVAQGFSVAAMDCRGQGGLSEDLGPVHGTTFKGHIVRGLDDTPEALAFRQIFLDTAQLARVVGSFEEVDAQRLGAMGGSQGGALTIACAALVPEIKRAAPVFPFLSDYQRVWEMDLDVDAYEEIRSYFRRFDPCHEREREIFTRLGYIDVQHLAGRIRGEVLMGITLLDKICPPSTQFAVFNKITAAKKALIYPDYGHESLPDLPDKTFEFLSGL